MTLSNEIAAATDAEDADVAEAVSSLVLLLQPFAPFITAELWARLGNDGPVAKAAWPTADPALIVVETATLVIQVNGKVRDRIDVPVSITEAEMLERARASDSARAHIDGKTIVKEIAVPPKLVNFVVR